MKTREDFILDTEQPRSIREMVAQELSYTTYYKDGERYVYPEPEPLDILMRKVYERIEMGAIQAYKSNKLWALKAWTYKHILTDSVAREAAELDEDLLTELVQPITEYQDSRDFDPIICFEKDMVGSYSQEYISHCRRTAQDFVLRHGKKRRYTDAEISDFRDYLKSRYKASTFAIMCSRLKMFLESLPRGEETGLRQQLPRWMEKRMPTLPSDPKDYETPTFTKEELEKMAIAALLDEPAEVVALLVIAQVHGLRIGELAEVSSEHINLNHGKPTITFMVEKKRKAGKPEPVEQAIPPELLPFYCVPLKRRNPNTIRRDLQRICQKAGVAMPKGFSVHAIRRRVAIMLQELTDVSVKEMDCTTFLRWSPTGRFGMHGRYAKIDEYASNLKVLAAHPMVKFWKDYADCWEWALGFDNVDSSDVYYKSDLSKSCSPGISVYPWTAIVGAYSVF